MWGGAQPAFFRNVVLAAKPAGAQLIDVFRRDNPELLAYTYQVHCSFTLRITVHYSTLCTRLKTAFTLTEVCCCKA
jgi:hypothetical protein